MLPIFVEIRANSTTTINVPDKAAVKTPANPDPRREYCSQQVLVYQGDSIPDKLSLFVDSPAGFIDSGFYLLGANEGKALIQKRDKVNVLNLHELKLVPVFEAIEALVKRIPVSVKKPSSTTA